MKTLVLFAILLFASSTFAQGPLASLHIWTDKATYSRTEDVKIHIDAFDAQGNRADCTADMHITNHKNFDVTWGFGILGSDYPAVQPIVDFWQARGKGTYDVTVVTYPDKKFTASAHFIVQ